MVAQNLLTAASLGLLATRVLAAGKEMNFRIFNAADCGTNPQTVMDESWAEVTAWQTNKKTKYCEASIMSLPLAGKDGGNGWTRTGESNVYQVWVDNKEIGDKCQLIFYDGNPAGDSSGGKKDACFSPLQIITNNVVCPQIDLPKEFGAAYCCGNDCNNLYDQRRWEPPAPRSIPAPRPVPARDVAAIKRAPPLQGRAPELDGDKKCAFEGDPKDITYKFLRPVRKSGTESCAASAQFPCPISAEFSTGQTITTSNGGSTNVGGGVGGFKIPFFELQAHVDVGHTWTWNTDTSASDTFSSSNTLQIPPGRGGWMTFSEKQACAKGKFVGNACPKDLTNGEDTFCVPSLIGRPDGKSQVNGVWKLVQTTDF